MASIHGKNSLSFRKKRTGTTDSSSPIINTDVKFAHESVLGGETLIDIDALVTPTSINTGILNPTGGQLTALNLKNNSPSIIIISSANGTLQQGSWQISNSGRQIQLAYETEPNEIFTIQVRTTQATANVVDADAFAITGTLIAGQTDIPLGQAFVLNANSTQQIGEVILTIDGVEQLRNVGNATAAVLADGNYEEVSSGNGQTNLLRLNQSFPVDVAYSVKSNGLIVNALPNNSVTQSLELLGGQLDAMIPTLADLAGVPDSDFQASPNNVDLKAFSDKVYNNADNIESNYIDLDTRVVDHENRITDLESNLDVFASYGLSTAFSVPTSETVLLLNEKLEDTYNMIDNSGTFKITIPPGKSGLYQISMANRVQDSSIGFTSCIFMFLRKGSPTVGPVILETTNSWYATQPYPSAATSKTLRLQAGEVYYLVITQNSGSPRPLTSGVAYTYLTIKGTGN